MKKLIVTLLASLTFAAPAFATSAPVQVRMHEPGCHWFYVNGKYVKTLTHRGSLTLVNYDEAALRYVGPGGTRIEKVGATIRLTKRGVYRVTMVKQARDDNTLTITIR